MALDVDNQQGEFVLDPHKYKERYLSWDRRIKGATPQNEAAIVRYVEDMRSGRNIHPRAVRGKRGYHRVLNQRYRLGRIAELLEAHEGVADVAPTASDAVRKLEGAVARLFSGMEEGRILQKCGKRYGSTRDYIKAFKAFWHWHIVWAKREHDISVFDITEFLTASEHRKAKFVYFGTPGSQDVEQGFRRLFEHANHRYRPLMAFLFDSGVRAPTEAMNVKRKDITPIPGTPYFQLHVRDETSKTFGRRIKLMFCHEHLRRHLDENHFEPDDFIFKISPQITNQYLKRLGERALAKPGLTMYDFRHNACCYFLPRYKNENALMYRFGWKDSAMIHYYSEFLGMKDTLCEDDFLVGTAKTQLEKDLDGERRQRVQVEEELEQLRSQMADINKLMNRLTDDPETIEFLARKARIMSIEVPK